MKHESAATLVTHAQQAVTVEQLRTELVRLALAFVQVNAELEALKERTRNAPASTEGTRRALLSFESRRR